MRDTNLAHVPTPAVRSSFPCAELLGAPGIPPEPKAAPMCSALPSHFGSASAGRSGTAPGTATATARATSAPGDARLRDGREGGRGGRRPQAAPPALRGRERSRTERHRPWVGARDGFPVRSHLFERSMRTPENSFSPSRNETTRASSMM